MGMPSRNRGDVRIRPDLWGRRGGASVLTAFLPPAKTRTSDLFIFVGCHVYGPGKTDKRLTTWKARKHVVPQRRRSCHPAAEQESSPQKRPSRTCRVCRAYSRRRTLPTNEDCTALSWLFALQLRLL